MSPFSRPYPPSSPATEMSSSRASHEMPTPPPMSLQFRRSTGVAFARRGNHSSGTLKVRPSAKATTSSHSPKLTPVASAETLGIAKELIPLILEQYVAILNFTADFGKLVGSKASRTLDPHRIEPVLCAGTRGPNVDLGWLCTLVAEEEEPIRADPQNCRHQNILRVGIPWAGRLTLVSLAKTCQALEIRPPDLGGNLRRLPDRRFRRVPLASGIGLRARMPSGPRASLAAYRKRISTRANQLLPGGKRYDG